MKFWRSCFLLNAQSWQGISEWNSEYMWPNSGTVQSKLSIHYYILIKHFSMTKYSCLV
jgi:hypothetical protein